MCSTYRGWKISPSWVHIENAVSYIYKNLCETELDNQQIAEAVGVSANYLTKLFQDHLGISLHTYMPFINEDVTICKNVFLCNRQQTQFTLMLLMPHTPFRTAVVSKALGVSRLSFAPENALQAFLHLSPGSVSPLGLLFDTERRVALCYEPEIRQSEQIAFHPCDNTATVIFTQDTFWNGVLPALGVRPTAVPMPGATPLMDGKPNG